MISKFRSLSKSPIAVVLFALIILSFAVFGISDVFTGGIVRDSVVQAGSRSINGAQFKSMFDNYRQQLAQQNQGQPVALDEAVANGLDRRMLENLAYQEALAALVTRIGLRPSDQQVVDEIEKSTAFFDRISGRFDRATYTQKLQEGGLTEAQFEALLRDDIAQSQLVSGLAAGLRPPRTYAATLGLFNREGRSLQWFAVDQTKVPVPTPPTEAELNAYIKSNAARFTKPETRQLTVVQFSAGQAAADVQIDPADVQKRFEFERDSLSTPELRTVIQIPAKDAATATAAAVRLRAGETPAAVAAALGVQPVTYTDAPKTAIADRQVADAAFAMQAGEVRAPVQGGLGLAVVKVDKITPGKIPTIEEVRPRIEEQVRRDAAIELVYGQVQKYEDARTGGANLADAAKAAGVTPFVLPVPITAEGATVTGQPVGAPPQLLQSAFALAEGGESEVENLAEGEYFAVRADKVIPPALGTLEEIGPAAAQVYMLEEFRKRMQAKADELAARVRKGEAVQTVAASIGAAVNREADLQRDVGDRPITADTVAAIFAAKPGETVVIGDERSGLVVAKIEGVVTGDVAELGRNVESQRLGLRSNVFNDMTAALRNAARDRVKPRIDYARARTALGLEPLPAEGEAAASNTVAPAPAAP